MNKNQFNLDIDMKQKKKKKHLDGHSTECGEISYTVINYIRKWLKSCRCFFLFYSP